MHQRIRISQEVGGVRLCQDGDDGAAHSELKTTLQKPLGHQGYVNIYSQSMV